MSTLQNDATMKNINKEQASPFRLSVVGFTQTKRFGLHHINNVDKRKGSIGSEVCQGSGTD